jgi:hypothetical protein
LTAAFFVWGSAIMAIGLATPLAAMTFDNPGYVDVVIYS